MFARTKRLTLRPGWAEDAPALAAAIGQESVAHRLSRVPLPYTLADAAEWLARPRAVTDLFFLVFLHDAGETRLIGGVGLHPEDGELGIGYWYIPAAWGHGYATEAGLAVIDIARHTLGVTRLASRYHLENPASGRVLRKLGFEPTGEGVHHPCLARGEPVPSVEYRLTRAAWAGEPAGELMAA